jgi:hypothetical protein
MQQWTVRLATALQNGADGRLMAQALDSSEDSTLTNLRNALEHLANGGTRVPPSSRWTACCPVGVESSCNCTHGDHAPAGRAAAP